MLVILWVCPAFIVLVFVLQGGLVAMGEIDLKGKIRRSIFTYAILSVLLVGTFVAIVSIWPFYNALKQSEAKRLLFAVKARAMIVAETLSKMEQVAMQITSRSRMLDVLEEYNLGKISKETFSAFTLPKLADPLNRSENAVGIIRLDLTKTIAVAAGKPLPEKIWRSLDLSDNQPQKYGPIEIDNKPYLIIAAPILNRKLQRAGTDIVLFDLTNLQDIIRDNSGLGTTGKTFLGLSRGAAVEIFFSQTEEGQTRDDPPAVYANIATAIRNASGQGSEAAILPTSPGSLATISYCSISGSDWGIAVRMDDSELYANINRQLIWIAVVIIGLIIAGITAVQQLLRPLTGQVIIHAEKLQAEIQEKVSVVERLKQTEHELLFTNTILTSQMETSLDGILIVDEKDEIISYNQRFVDIWQIPDEVLQKKSDKSALKFIYNQVLESELFLERIESLYASREEKSREDICLKDGRILDRYSTPMISPGGTYYGRTWYFRDITEQNNMEVELFKVKKLESVGVLAGGIAHDFNNILAAILGNINLAIRRSQPDEKTLPLLKNAEKASLRAKGLTQQLLTFSKGGAPVKKVVSIENVIKESADFVLHGSNVRCVWNFSEALRPIEIDPGQIGQVIQNIVLNASQAMPEGGVVDIGCTNISCPQGPAAHLPAGDYLKITLTDSGVGIPGSLIDEIFDPYFTNKPTGSGLGLAITHSIINKHQGHISVESQPGIGTTFTLYLPAFEGTQIADQQSIEQPAEKGSGLIMVMDDDEMLRNIVKEMLEDSGYEVLQATNGEEAIAVYQNSAKQIDAVIMDLTIPGGMGGQEAVEKLLAIDPAAKVIVSSGYSHDPIMAKYQDYGFCGAIEKPYKWQELEVLLQKILANLFKFSLVYDAVFPCSGIL